jgi:hypothetical protein
MLSNAGYRNPELIADLARYGVPMPPSAPISARIAELASGVAPAGVERRLN